jgi:hypothetical protein
VAPSIDLEQGFYNVCGLALTRSATEIQSRKPVVHWLLSRVVRLFLSRKRRENLLQRLNGNARNSAAFQTYNTYVITKLAHRI